MITNPTNMKIVFVVLLTLAMLTMTATPVLAASPHTPTISRTNGLGAVARWPGPIGQFSNINLIVDKTQVGTDIFLFVDTPTSSAPMASLTTTANVLQITPLNSITLSPVTLSVCVGTVDEFGNCSQTVPVTIQATWTGFGPTQAFAGTIHINLVRCCDQNSIVQFSGTMRAATATGSLNGQNLGQTSTCQFCSPSIFGFKTLLVSPIFK